jgi:hypothetical protein
MKKQFLNAAFAILAVSFCHISCKKGISDKPGNENINPSMATNSISARQKSENKIKVSNVYELYDAVNNDANEGAQIELEPGTYELIPGYPKPESSGRIEFQRDMQLYGQQGHPNSVIIDASTLPGTSFAPPLNFPAKRTGAIRMGKGTNILEWVKVIGNNNTQPLSVIDTDLIGEGVSSIRIAHTIVTGGRIGINLRNVGPASVDRVIEAEIVDNELTNNLVSDPGTQQGQGLVMQNANGATGAVIRATLNGNNIHGNIIGMKLFNNNGNPNTHNDNSSISIQSNADRFDDNNLGIYIVGGSNGAATNATVNGNKVTFEAHGTSIRNNSGIMTDAITSPCGIRITGGSNSQAGSSASNNIVEMRLTGCTISSNEDYDIVPFGALSTTSTLAGTNNVVNIYLNGVSANATVATPVGSVPTETAATNVVNVFR